MYMKDNQSDSLSERAAGYKKMLHQILPLALISGILFFGKKFRQKYKEFLLQVLHHFPLRYYSGWVIGLLFLPFLIISTSLGRIKFALSPHND